MNARLSYGILLVFILVTGLGLGLAVTTTVIYAQEKDTFPSSYHDNTDVLRQQSLNSTTDVLPLMQDLLDYSGPIVLNVRVNDIDQARRDLESFSKNRVAFRNLVVNLDMNESEIQKYADSLALQDKMFQDLVNSSASLEQLRTLEIRYRNENNPNQLISVQMEGEDLRNKIHDLYGRYETETEKIVNVSKKQGLDITVEEQSLVQFQQYVQEIDARKTPAVPPPGPASLLTLVLIMERGRFGDTIDCAGYLVSPYGLSTPDRSRKNVTVLVDNAPLLSAITDSSGHYSLQLPIGRIRAGIHQVQAESSSARSEIRTLTVMPVDSKTSLSVEGITPKGGVTVTGSVLANRPVTLAPVELVWDGEHVIATTTDTWGEFREVLRLPAGKHTVIARFTGNGYPINPSASEPQEVDIATLNAPDYSWLVLPLMVSALILAFSGAALVLAALTCLITGIFLSLLSTSEPLDTRYVSLLSVQGCINLCRVAEDMGIQGQAHVVPAGKKGMTTTMQFIPVADYDGSPLSPDTFVDGTTTAGLLVPPSGYPLLREMKGANLLVIPQDEAALPELLKEVMTDVFEVADRVTVLREGSTASVTLEGFRLISGCLVMTAESPVCCTMNPCPVCSVIACILAEGTGTVVKTERCSPDSEKKTVTALFTLME